MAMRSDAWIAAEALMAFRRGDDSDDARFGAYLIAEALHIYRKQNTKG